MMNKIKPLSKHLINLIAAGEVIERPMNVVKELVENSLDAKATNIIINLKDCGIKEIEIIDNGIGISKEDLPIALQKHTTSKIQTEDDLFNIATLGFRGEALASIASVSDFYIASNNKETNYFLHKKADILIDEGIANINPGTKIIVKNLFYNTPARFKNLANQYTELAVTQDLIQKFALSNPNISFTFTNNDKLILKTNNNLNIDNSQLSVATNIYGSDVAKCLITFNGENNLYQITGLASNNEIFRSSRNNVTILVNGRIIKNYAIYKSIIDAYQTILPVGKYPVVILNINCANNILDVNVHPSKLEIRFSDEQGLKALITTTIKNSLINSELLKYQKEEFDDDEFKEEIEVNYSNDEKKIDNPWDEQFDFNLKNIKIIEPTVKEDEIKKVEQLSIEDLEEGNFKRHFFQKLRYIGQYNITYLIMEHDGTLYIIDQHAAMERVMYEYISKEILNTNTYQIELSIPIELNYNLAEQKLLFNKQSEINQLKIEFEKYRNDSIIVRKIPTWIPKNNEVEFLQDIFDAFMNNLSLNKKDVLDDLIKSMSCKKSIKANMAISNEEVNALMLKLDQCEMPYSCPHGRPTIIKFTNYDIEKLFKRVNQ